MITHQPDTNIKERPVDDDASRILDDHRIMAISTVRPDGWPQTTIVGFANEGLQIYFLLFRSSQKFANIRQDNRVSVAVGGEPRTMGEAKAVFAGALASEVVEAGERDTAWRLLVQRHPNLAGFDLPSSAEAALMRAVCKHVSVLDYTKGFGHTEAFSIGDDDAILAHDPRPEDWGGSLATEH